MLQLSHRTLIILSGLVWFAVGVFLLQLGLNLLLEAVSMAPSFHNKVLGSLGSAFGGKEQAAIVLIAVALLIGYMKGRYVLGKSAKKGVERILKFPNPTSLANIYSAKYYVLLGLMIGLGMSMRFLGVPNDVRGFVDVAIGAALINGAVLYFRFGASAGSVEGSCN